MRTQLDQLARLIEVGNQWSANSSPNAACRPHPAARFSASSRFARCHEIAACGRRGLPLPMVRLHPQPRGLQFLPVKHVARLQQPRFIRARIRLETPAPHTPADGKHRSSSRLTGLKLYFFQQPRSAAATAPATHPAEWPHLRRQVGVRRIIEPPQHHQPRRQHRLFFRLGRRSADILAAPAPAPPMGGTGGGFCCDNSGGAAPPLSDGPGEPPPSFMNAGPDDELAGTVAAAGLPLPGSMLPTFCAGPASGRPP